VKIGVDDSNAKVNSQAGLAGLIWGKQRVAKWS